MSCSKPVPSFIFDSLYYLNRNQLERFSIVCRHLKNFIERYFNSKPYRIFDKLEIRSESYALQHNNVQWHSKLDDYNLQQFLAGQRCTAGYVYYSFAKIRPYLGPTVRIKVTMIFVAEDSTYIPEQVEEMETISHLWRDGKIGIRNAFGSRFGAENIQLILNSPTILQCRELEMYNANFRFMDYKILYAVKVIVIYLFDNNEIDLWVNYWQEFLEQLGVKPVVVFRFIFWEHSVYLLKQLSKAFSSAVSPNAFKIVFVENDGRKLTEFQKTNNTSGEILELKKGLPIEYLKECFEEYDNYTLERSSI